MNLSFEWENDSDDMGIEAIIKRNEGYCKAYNAGIYTLEKWNERVNSPEIQHYFNIIKNLSRKERTV